MAGTGAATRALILLCCVSLTTACEARSPSLSLEARTVIRAEPGQFCSLFVDDPAPPEERHARISRLLAYLDHVRTSLPDIDASYLDLRGASGATLTATGPCNGKNESLEKARAQASAMGFRASAAFAPEVQALSGGGGAPSRLSEAVQRLNGPRASLASCTMAIRLSPSSSADADARFNATIANARDEYGFPLLFSAQKDSIFYASLYRQCDDLESAFELLKAISATDPAHGIKMLGYVRANEDDLRKVYGSVF